MVSGHVIVCGLGDVGFRVVELLHRLGEPVQVVTDQAREERRRAVEARGIRIVFGDARHEQLLLDAGLLTAKALLAGTNDDLANIEIALDARRYRPDLPIVLRLFDQELARQLEPMLEVRRALGMSSLAAPSFAASALGDSILASFRIGDVPFVLGRQRVDGGALASLHSVGAVARVAQIHTLLRETPDGLTALPSRDEPIAAGDRLSLLARKVDWDHLFGTPEPPPEIETVPWRDRLRKVWGRMAAAWRGEPLFLRSLLVGIALLIPTTVLFFRLLLGRSLSDALFFTLTNLYGSIVWTDSSPGVKLFQVLLLVLGSISIATFYSLFTAYLVGFRLKRILGGQPLPRGGHVIVVGMGRVGFRILEELVAMGVPVAAVDADPTSPFLGAVRTVAPVVTGDARSADVLAHAHLATARAVVAATGDDAVNLSISLTAKRANPRVRTVSRLFDAQFARKVESVLGVDAAMGASRVAAPTFTAALLVPDVAKAVIVRDRFLVLLERRAGADWAGWKPSELRAKRGLHILLRDGDLTTASVAAVDERPLREGEVVLAAFCRELASPWGEGGGQERLR